MGCLMSNLGIVIKKSCDWYTMGLRDRSLLLLLLMIKKTSSDGSRLKHVWGDLAPFQWRLVLTRLKMRSPIRGKCSQGRRRHYGVT